MINENFDCALCQGILQTPCECPGCHANFCQSHISQFRQCPMCNGQFAPSQYKRNIALERMIIEYPFSCTNGCGFTSRNLLELEKHIANCHPTPIKCVLCPYQGNEEMFWAHLVEQHKRQIINQFGSTGQKANPQSNEVIANPNSNVFGPQITSGIYEPPQRQSNYVQVYPNFEKLPVNDPKIYGTVRKYNYAHLTELENKNGNKDYQYQGKVYDQNAYTSSTGFQKITPNYKTQINYQAYNTQTAPNQSNAINYRATVPAPIPAVTKVERNIQNGRNFGPSSGSIIRARVNFSPGRVMKVPVNRRRLMMRRVASPSNSMLMKRIQIV